MVFGLTVSVGAGPPPPQARGFSRRGSIKGMSQTVQGSRFIWPSRRPTSSSLPDVEFSTARRAIAITRCRLGERTALVTTPTWRRSKNTPSPWAGTSSPCSSNPTSRRRGAWRLRTMASFPIKFSYLKSNANPSPASSASTSTPNSAPAAINPASTRSISNAWLPITISPLSCPAAQTASQIASTSA